ncbi:MAG TPA: TonB family protein, partial [bacterium]|nr:TonB family protein [bacterium]
KVLSQPKVVCLSGEEAKISVGGEVPVVTTTTGESGTATNVEYKEYGVILKIRPIVMENDMVKINLYTEVSDIDWINAVTASGISIPAFSKREASTELFIKTGETVFIGGLIKSDKSKDVEKIPAIGNIPVLGALFRSKDFQNDKTELVISLTPDIIKYGEDPILKEETDGYKVITGDPNTQPSNDLRKYIWNIQRKIISSLIYPPSAEEQAVQGEIKLSLHLFSDGTLSGVRVIQSSGHRVLDDTVIDTVKRLSPYEPFPSSMEEKEVWIEVPIVYSLN